ncbi:hypothetical protein ACF3OB_04895 [Capnocytophaga canis]|uniref:hypothetical protein n=1 Tax=Capnocytophaga canis TaxID=1848903 RepID=UPI00370DCFA0
MKKQNQTLLIILEESAFFSPEYYQIMTHQNVKYLKINCYSVIEGRENLYSIKEFFLNRNGVVEWIFHYQYFEPYEYKKVTFDAYGKKIQALYYDSDGNLELKQIFTYDENNNNSEILTLQNEEFYAKVTRKFNEKGQEIFCYHEHQNDRLSGYSESFYDESGRLISIKYFYSDKTHHGSVFYEYDKYGFCCLYRWKSAINEDDATIQKNIFDSNGKILKSEIYKAYNEEVPFEVFQYEMDFFDV